jgi:hypothetical protein
MSLSASIMAGLELKYAVAIPSHEGKHLVRTKDALACGAEFLVQEAQRTKASQTLPISVMLFKGLRGCSSPKASENLSNAAMEKHGKGKR